MFPSILFLYIYVIPFGYQTQGVTDHTKIRKEIRRDLAVLEWALASEPRLSRDGSWDFH